MRAVIVAALFAVVALSGCVGSTGLSLQNVAEREATSIAEDAVLVGVLGAEWTNESLVAKLAEESPEAASLDQGVDENPGDGQANAWAFFFHSEEDSILVTVAADGEVLEAKTLPSGYHGSETFGFQNPLGDVSVDSDEAAVVVMENHERFADVVQEEDAMVMMFLVRDDEFLDGVYWAFMAFTVEGEDFVLALVDAEDGSYRDFGGWFGG